MPQSTLSESILSIIIPCFNEQATLTQCLEKVLSIQDDILSLQVIIVDDASTDNSLAIARHLEQIYPEVTVLHHPVNQGKGAALRTGFKAATGNFVAIQDADLEYDPNDLKKLMVPLVKGEADVVLGSRFMSSEQRRVLYFWHALGNRFLTLLSNMFTDLNLTDMETCYKVFRTEVIRRLELHENRFGIEPEIVSQIAHMRLKIYEIGISYRGRTYAEGKKIGWKDGFRALYCIFKYNAPKAPVPVQFLFYLVIGGIAAIVNLACFLVLVSWGAPVMFAAPAAFILAAAVNYLLCISLLFRHKAKWSFKTELVVYGAIVCFVCLMDLVITKLLMGYGVSPALSKILATLVGLVLNFSGRRYLVFPEKSTPGW